MHFWTFLYLRLNQFLLNKSPNFPDLFGLLFKTVIYSKQSSITGLNRVSQYLQKYECLPIWIWSDIYWNITIWVFSSPTYVPAYCYGIGLVSICNSTKESILIWIWTDIFKICQSGEFFHHLCPTLWYRVSQHLQLNKRMNTYLDQKCNARGWSFFLHWQCWRQWIHWQVPLRLFPGPHGIFLWLHKKASWPIFCQSSRQQKLTTVPKVHKV